MKKKVTSAPTGEIEKYKDEVSRILFVLGESNAYVTDESLIRDFMINPKLLEESGADELDVVNQKASNAAMIDSINSMCDGCNITEDSTVLKAAQHIFHFEGEIK